MSSLLAIKASQVVLVVKNLPARTHETWVQSLSQGDPLQEKMAIHSSILAWEIPGTDPWGHKELNTTNLAD